MASSRVVAWLLRLRDASRGPVTVYANRRSAATLQMLGLHRLFRLVVSDDAACGPERAMRPIHDRR